MTLQDSTRDSVLVFTERVSGELLKLQTDFRGIHEMVGAMRADLNNEARVRGGELSILQQKLSREFADALTTLRQELDGRFYAVEGQTTQWAQTLRRQFQGVKPRLDSMEMAIPERLGTMTVSDQRLSSLERELPDLHRGLANMSEAHSAQCAEMDAKWASQSEQHSSEVRAIAANNAAEIRRLGECLDNMRRQDAAAKTAANGSAYHLEALVDKVTLMQKELRAKACTLEVRSLVESSEQRIQESLERMDKNIGGESARTESPASGKAPADRATALTVEVQGSAARARQDRGGMSQKVNEANQEFYRRDEIDAMMTRVWWRLGDAGKSPKGALPQLAPALKR